MEKEIKIRKKQPASARMSAALDLLIDFLLEDYGKDTKLSNQDNEGKRKPNLTFRSKGNHKLV
ncbi:MAG: hypothetical protein WAS33_25410 [Candidatus Promineifilaceae bacterium]|jgi:hypothetical protein